MANIGIIAGGGTLPQRLIQACQRAHRPFFVLALKGQADPSILQGVPYKWVRLGATSRAIAILKDAGVDTVVMAGSVRRPGLFDMLPDFRTIKAFLQHKLSTVGDDGMLRAVTREFEKDGFTVIGAHEIEPDLITPEGVLTAKQPSPRDQSDIHEGIEVVRNLGKMDVGQAAIIREGVVLGLEGPDGTDALIKRCRDMFGEKTGGVLVKACKPQQDKRVDLPTIGLRTVHHAYEAGLSGIAIESGASLILNRDEVIAAADKLGLFIAGFKKS